MKTKDRILQIAISLFNQAGTKNITTNHIAEAANMSIGNLYYHFKNKEEIIQAILEQIIENTNDLLSHSEEKIHSFVFAQEMFAKIFHLQYQYRFFHNEIASLLKNDPNLQKRYQELQKIRFIELEILIQQLIQQEILQPKALEEYLPLREATWLIWTFWITNLEIEGKTLQEHEIQRGVWLLFELFVPHLTEKGLQHFSQMKKQWQDSPMLS